MITEQIDKWESIPMYMLTYKDEIHGITSLIYFRLSELKKQVDIMTDNSYYCIESL